MEKRGDSEQLESIEMRMLRMICCTRIQDRLTVTDFCSRIGIQCVGNIFGGNKSYYVLLLLTLVKSQDPVVSDRELTVPRFS